MNIDTTGIQDTLKKLKRKNPSLFKAIQKKVNQIAELDKVAIQHVKNSRAVLEHTRNSFGISQ